MRILHVINSMALGGAEKVVSILMSRHNSDNLESHICCLSTKGELGEFLEKKSFQITSLNKELGIQPTLIYGLSKVIRASAYDIIHCHNIGTSIYVVPVSLLFGIPCIITLHGSTDYPERTTQRSHYANLWPLKLVKKIVTVCDRRKYELINQGIKSDKIITVYNGIDVETIAEPGIKLAEDFSFFKNSKFIIGTVGNLNFYKNHLALLQAFNLFLKKYKFYNPKLIIIGEGPERKTLEKYIINRRLKKHVFLLGKMNNPLTYVRLFDLFVLPSLTEGLSIALLEAMALGKSVIATDVGGNTEVVEDGKNGIILPLKPANFAQRLADLLGDLMVDKDGRRLLGRNAQLTVSQKFNAEIMVSEYEKLYKACFNCR